MAEFRMTVRSIHVRSIAIFSTNISQGRVAPLSGTCYV